MIICTALDSNNNVVIFDCKVSLQISLFVSHFSMWMTEVCTVFMRVQREYDVNILGTNHHPIIWLSCILNGQEKTQFYLYSTNDEAGNPKFYKPKYALNKPKCATFCQNPHHTTHWDADLVPRP